MKRRKLLMPAVASLLSFTLFSSGGSSFAAAPSHVQLNGAAPIAAKHGKLIDHTSRSTKSSLTIALKLRNSDQLDSFIASLNDPSSPNYKHFLTPEEFKQQFGPTDETVANVKDYLKSQGFKVETISSNNAFITVSGTTGQMEDAFSVTINNYKNSNGQAYFANDKAPEIPAEFAGVITDVEGLDNESRYTHPQIRKPSPQVSNKPAAVEPRVGSGPSGGYTPAELKGAYNVSPLASAGYTGSGQTVAVMELDGYVASNVTNYSNYYGLGSPAPTNVYIDGFNGAACEGQVEVELDIEVINAIAPKAQVIVYEGPNTGQGLIDTYQKIATENKAKSISVSWGIGEQHASTASMNSLHTIFQQYATQGQSIFAASGDNGAYDSGGSTLEVDSPANDPYVTGVGGTHLNLSGSSYSSESIWANSSNKTGGGGGLSTLYAMPSFQSGTGVQNSYSNGKRQVPDVSADADPSTGYSIYSQGAWTVVGGTSAAAPLWAGIAALNNQYAAANGKGNLGQANPTLYKMFNTTQTYPAYHDVTSGNNLYYPATAGYDMASGIGTPDAYNLVRDINGSSGGSGGGGTVTELITNGGFESGQSPWTESSTGGYQLIDTSRPHTGSSSAYLNGYNSSTDTIYQTVTIPSTATSATLTFWTYVSTTETSHAYDYLYAQVRNTSGSALSTLLTLNDGTATGWVQRSYSLLNYKGQTVQIAFKGTNDSSNPTDFFVDDVSLKVQ
ncbi:protease pro-enzyme activation domain-containing protein [Neobacillus sp. PS3-34]|uniref:protease pro-enzyme activation domain-containing protein n=1 Tax=Neobacillus sp. PS3-34 TaxID=3070678 RepID=UPI0027E010B1|nr:protease pro-enzyme activation domain-containing protein [Neobacillus sp. PS3-34]WML49039.1 protease pro-enzyme activation domain-containing protein [Neobacillus sp. PS3-34]